ncbi:RmlC-like jelly roll fold protein [Diaporthe eres]|nr:RmlC-like jelly roll fold protein [Diaporthe eres]
MDAQHEAYAATLNVNHFKPENVPWRRLGQYFWRPIEDGSNTQYRLAVIESLIPPRSDGPIVHFHEMHDEGFFVTKGKVRFHVPGRPTVDVCAGEALTVPVRLPHKFSNPFDEEAIFINTATPGFFIRYFELLENMIGEGKVLTPEINAEALKRFATIPVPVEDVKRLESQGWPSVNGNSKTA